SSGRREILCGSFIAGRILRSVPSRTFGRALVSRPKRTYVSLGLLELAGWVPSKCDHIAAPQQTNPYRAKAVPAIVLAYYLINLCKSLIFLLRSDYHTAQINGAMVDIADNYRRGAVTGVTLPQVTTFGARAHARMAVPDHFRERVCRIAFDPLAGSAERLS